MTLGLSFRATLLLANLTSLAWLAIYHLLLQNPGSSASPAEFSPVPSSEVLAEGGRQVSVHTIFTLPLL